MIRFIFKFAERILVLSLVSVINVSCFVDIDHAQGEIADEPTQSSIIFRKRLPAAFSQLPLSQIVKIKKPIFALLFTTKMEQYYINAKKPQTSKNLLELSL